ncbi:hypothetical protein CSV86_029560 [Pseudomonas putida CSV86]|uniref:Uncharacterized protein n=1 Tax=Pseudomonas bharatica CSV86 TaxID=1005395 RepID=A0A7K4ENQ4_9PSED|nr:autotransporter-associated beta strand repeat-containing protein [Pseudomonas bharatica]NNJ18961.1 hypothetical protein [Pseudomonas bharatica CSV86]
MDLAGNLTIGGTSALGLNGVIDGVAGAGLIKNGTADLILNAVNTYSGDTQLNAGAWSSVMPARWDRAGCWPMPAVPWTPTPRSTSVRPSPSTAQSTSVGLPT